MSEGPTPVDGYATGAYAALTACGLNYTGGAVAIMDQLRDHLAELADNPNTSAIGTGNLYLRRAMDGDEEYGIHVAIELGMIPIGLEGEAA